MLSVNAFLQARMGSNRLPGKVLLPIRGKSILKRAIERLEAAKTVSRVVVVTTTLSEDDQVVEEATSAGASIHRGPEFDVLERFRQAAGKFRPDIIVRATADNPLIDIGSIDRIVRAIQKHNLHYCMERGLPIGSATEAMTRSALESVESLARAERDREHVTLYFKEHPEEFRIAFLDAPDGLRRPDLSLTVDTAQDFTFVESLIQRIREPIDPLPLEKYLDFEISNHLTTCFSGPVRDRGD